MSAPVSVRGEYNQLFGANMLPVLEEIFWSTYNQHPMRRDSLFKTVSHDRDIWQASEMHDMDLFAQVNEGAEYTFTRPKQGSSRTLTVLKYGLGASISKEMIDDGKYDFVADVIRKLGRSARETQEITGMNVFNNGFSTELANDGLSVFNSAHTLPSGSTYRNLLSVAADLSVTSYEQALLDFETQFVGDSGIIENIRPKTLLCNPANKRYARELTQSEGKPDTADNNMNSFKEEEVQYMSSPHLTDSASWFLCAAPEETGLRIIERQALRTDSDMANGFATDSILYKSSYREVVGVTVAKGVYGTPGV